jgi:hypothetical protein
MSAVWATLLERVSAAGWAKARAEEAARLGGAGGAADTSGSAGLPVTEVDGEYDYDVGADSGPLDPTSGAAGAGGGEGAGAMPAGPGVASQLEGAVALSFPGHVGVGGRGAAAGRPATCNQLEYGQEQPPSYDLSRIVTPLTFFTGEKKEGGHTPHAIMGIGITSPFTTAGFPGRDA